MPSTREEFINNSLNKYNHRFIYQYAITNLSGVRGAYIVDWLVTSTVPLSTPLEYFGGYWHDGQLGAEDDLRIQQINDAFGGQANEVVVLKNINSQEESDQKILATIGRG